MRRMSRRVWRLAAGTITVALFTACSPDSPSTSPKPVLTQPEANAVAEVVATDAASLAGGATLDAATGMPFAVAPMPGAPARSEEHTSELQSHSDLVCRLLLEKKKTQHNNHTPTTHPSTR